LIDSDNCPVKDPTFLFESPEFKQTGALFWPDFWRTALDNPIWNIVGIKPVSEWEQESGQLLIDKQKSWKALNLAVHFNSEKYMQLLNGDKDTFRFAWLAAKVPYTMASSLPTPVGTLKELHSMDVGFCGHTMLQHWKGTPMFVHHNNLKRTVFDIGENFKFKKVAGNATHFRAVPTAALELPDGQMISCLDLQIPIDDETVVEENCIVTHSGLELFEVEYFAAQDETIPLPWIQSEDVEQQRLLRRAIHNASTITTSTATPKSGGSMQTTSAVDPGKSTGKKHDDHHHAEEKFHPYGYGLIVLGLLSIVLIGYIFVQKRKKDKDLKDAKANPNGSDAYANPTYAGDNDGATSVHTEQEESAYDLVQGALLHVGGATYDAAEGENATYDTATAGGDSTPGHITSVNATYDTAAVGDDAMYDTAAGTGDQNIPQADTTVSAGKKKKMQKQMHEPDGEPTKKKKKKKNSKTTVNNPAFDEAGGGEDYLNVGGQTMARPSFIVNANDSDDLEL
jgi:hypothetical protein